MFLFSKKQTQTESQTPVKRTCEKDYYEGYQSELEHFDYFKTHFKDKKLKMSASKYALFDYYSDETCIELKTRKTRMNFYRSTIVGMNKIKEAHKLYLKGKNIYFCFKFTNGLYYVRYSDERFKDFESKYYERKDRDKVEKKLYCCIPIEYLIEF